MLLERRLATRSVALDAIGGWCRETPTIDRRLRLGARRVNLVYTPSSPVVLHVQEPPASRKSQTVPRAAVVNARRPGPWPGRSAAKSIDDGEHGTRLTGAMPERLDTLTELDRFLRAKLSR